MSDQVKQKEKDGAGPIKRTGRVVFEIYGEEIVEKKVKPSGNSGRVYLPLPWVGSRVKIIRLN